MKELKRGPLAAFLLGRANLIEILFIAIFIAFGASIIVSSITLYTWYEPIVGIIGGAILCIISVTYLIYRIYGQKVRKEIYDGFIVYHKPKNQLIGVPRYGFGDSLNKYLNSAFCENTALKTIWEKEKIGISSEYDQDRKVWIRKDSKSNQLIREATEYYILSKLSSHLNSYFSSDGIDKGDLDTFERHELPDVLLSNRFLELFSKPMEERPCFVDEALENDNKRGKVVAIYVQDGGMYEEFTLVLPKNSKINRIDKNQIQIKTNRFTMNISVDFDGCGSVLPRGFEKYYLSVDKFIDINNYKIRAKISIKFKLRFLFSLNGWEYYQWVDSFLNKLDEEMSQDRFFNYINWDSIYTAIHCFHNISNSLKEVSATKDTKEDLQTSKTD